MINDERHDESSAAPIFLAADALADHIRQRAATHRPATIAVDGLAGSGKSTFSRSVARQMCARGLSVAEVALDDGFWVDDQGRCPGETRALLADYDWQRLRADVLDPLQNAEGTCPYRGFDVVLVEGCFTLRDELVAAFDLKVFVYTPRQESLERAIQRDGDQSRDYYECYWRAQEDFYLRTQAPLSKADFVVDGRRPASPAGWPLVLEPRMMHKRQLAGSD